MDTIYYNGYEYRKIYDHEAGGTYFESDTADIVTSCLVLMYLAIDKM